MTMPSGPNPSGYDLTNQDGPIVGGGLSALAGRTQDSVAAGAKSNIQGSPGYGAASGTFFGTILSGFGSLGGLLGSIVGVITGVIGGGLSILGGFITALVGSVVGIIGAIISAFTGIGGSSGSYADAQVVMTATAATIAANSASLQAIQAQQAADSNNGANFFIDFSQLANATSLPGFTLIPTGSGTFGISSGLAVLQPAGSGSFVAIDLYLSIPTLTDYQLISAVYKNAPAAAGGFQKLTGRSNAAGTTNVSANLGYGSVNIQNTVGGVISTVATQSIPFVAGAVYSLECGQLGSIRTYNILLNGSPICTWVDSSSSSNVGTLYRFCGLGAGRSVGAAGTTAVFGFVDNAPGPLIGDMFECYSSVTTPIALTSGNVAAVAPASFYSNVQDQSSNYTYTAATNKLVVKTAGVYLVELSTQWVMNATATYSYFGLAVLKNGLVYKSGLAPYNPTFNPPFFNVAHDSFTVRLNINDYIQPGFFALNSPAANKTRVVGDASGQTAAFSCALINTGISG